MGDSGFSGNGLFSALVIFRAIPKLWEMNLDIFGARCFAIFGFGLRSRLLEAVLHNIQFFKLGFPSLQRPFVLIQALNDILHQRIVLRCI